MATHLILGAGGAVTVGLCKALLGAGHKVILLSRKGYLFEGTTSLKADLLDKAAVASAMQRADVAHLVAGLPYRAKVWERDWPRIMTHCLDAAETTGCKLIFLDNIYAYGMVKGPIREGTPHAPVSRKGEVRAQIADQLLQRIGTGRVQGILARSADFYGPGSEANSVPGNLIFKRLAAGKKAQALGSPDVPHSFTYVPDIGPALLRLASHPGAWGQVWHLPTAAPPITTRQFAKLASEIMNGPEGCSTISRLALMIGGLVDRTLCELSEMLYQYEQPYLFSSAKYEAEFGHLPTSYKEGIRQTASLYGRVAEPQYSFNSLL